MLHFATIVGLCVSILLIAIAAIFQFLDIVWDRQDKERIKERIVAFWIKTAELAAFNSVTLALEGRYRRTRTLRKKFIVLFWMFCCIAAAVACYETLQSDMTNFRESYAGILRFNFDTDYQIRCLFSHSGEKDAAKDRCDPANSSNNTPEMQDFRAARDKFVDYANSLSPSALTWVGIASNLFTVIIVAIPSSIALYISFNLTLFILSAVTRSRIHFALLLIFDAFVAVFMPPFLTSFMIVVAVGGEVLVSGQIFSIASFTTLSWLTLALGSAFLNINLNFFWIAFGFLALSIFPSQVVAIITALALLNVPLFLTVLRIQSFIDDVIKVLQLDFSPDLVQAIIDWAIFTDILFSLVYLAPAFLIVIAGRNSLLRKAFLNLVMWVGDHAKGPFVAISELASIVFAVFRSLK